MSLRPIVDEIKQGRSLSRDETKEIFDRILAGDVPAEDMAAFLTALHNKGESVSEIEGAVLSMRGAMKTISAPADALDIVGTGGDGHGTLNVSTAAAFVAAGAGVKIAKHGNRAATSLSGSSDVLQALGVNLQASWDCMEDCAHRLGLVFLFAPNHHSSMKHVAPVRRNLGIRTIFNLLGPLTNPANVKRHVIGVYDHLWSEPMAKTLAALGSDTAWIMHGHGGMDEISLTGPTRVVGLCKSQITHFELSPEQAGVPRAEIKSVKGGSPEANAQALRDLLDGQRGPYRDIVILNAGAALVVGGLADSYARGVSLAAEAIDNGAAKDKLEQLIVATNKAG